jgi:hypothetical protein
MTVSATSRKDNVFNQHGVFSGHNSPGQGVRHPLGIYDNYCNATGPDSWHCRGRSLDIRLDLYLYPSAFSIVVFFNEMFEDPFVVMEDDMFVEISVFIGESRYRIPIFVGC